MNRMTKEKTPLKWKFKTENSVSSSPAVVDGVVYFGSSDYHLYAVDIKTGEEKWKFKTGGNVQSSPIVSEGVVYFGSWDSHLYAVDIKTGEEKWKFKTGDNVHSSPALVDGVVYFGSADSHLYAIDIQIALELYKKHTKEEKQTEQKKHLEEKERLKKLEELEAEKRSHWKPDTEENLKKIRELMVSSNFSAGIELALSLDDQYLLLELVEGCRIGENGAITLNETFKANAYVKNTNITEDEDYDILVNALFKIILKINNILKPDSSLKIENIKILDLHSFVNLPVEITAFPNLETIFIALRHDAVPDEYSAIKGLVIKKIFLKRELMRAIWDKVVDDLSEQSYETEVSHQQADNHERLEEDKYDYAIDDEPCPCGSGKNYEDCDGVEKVRIPSGEYIMEDEEFDKEFFNYVNTDELGSGVLSKKEIEDWIDESVPTLCRSYESVSIGQGDDRMYLSVESLYYSLEDFNPEWTDDEYYLDDEKMEDYIKEVFSDLGYE